MRFIIGLITGVAIGAVAANIANSPSGQDMRGEFDRLRSDLEKRDFDAVGATLESRFKDLQSSLEERFAQADSAAGDAAEEAEDAVDDAADAVADATDDAKDAVKKRASA